MAQPYVFPRVREGSDRVEGLSEDPAVRFGLGVDGRRRYGLILYGLNSSLTSFLTDVAPRLHHLQLGGLPCLVFLQIEVHLYGGKATQKRQNNVAVWECVNTMVASFNIAFPPNLKSVSLHLIFPGKSTVPFRNLHTPLSRIERVLGELVEK